MDYRTKRQKLEAMANQSASPHEAEIAKKKLAEMPKEDVEFKSPFWGISINFTMKYATSTNFWDVKPSGVKHAKDT